MSKAPRKQLAVAGARKRLPQTPLSELEAPNGNTSAALKHFMRNPSTPPAWINMISAEVMRPKSSDIAHWESEAGGRAAAPVTGVPVHLRLSEAVDSLKRDMIRAALGETGSKTGAAQKLGIPRQSLQKMMKRLDMAEDE